MWNQLIKNVKYPENLYKLLDSINKSYRDSKSKKSSVENYFTLTYVHFSNGIVFFGTPCTTILVVLQKKRSVTALFAYDLQKQF